MATKQAASRESSATASKAPRKRNSKAPAAPAPTAAEAAAPLETEGDGLVATESAPEAQQAPPTHDEIAVRAYSLWASRGFQGGDPTSDWVTAERQLRERVS